MCRKLWGHDIINSLIWIFIRTGQEMFSEKMWNFKCHNFLTSYPIFIIFAPICRKIFMLSFEIMVILDWTSPLSSLEWSSVYNTENVNASFKNFIDTFMLHLNKIIPSQNPSRSNYRKIPRAPWISKAILRSINRKIIIFIDINKTPPKKLKDSILDTAIHLQIYCEWPKRIILLNSLNFMPKAHGK